MTMIHGYLDDSRTLPIILTDEHAASSYGQPVLVMGCVAYGAGDVLPSGKLAATYDLCWMAMPMFPLDADSPHALAVSDYGRAAALEDRWEDARRQAWHPAGTLG